MGAWSAAWAQKLGGEFMIFASLKPKVSPTKVLGAIESQIRQLREKAVTQKELDKARNLLMKGYVDSLKRLSGRAHMLAQNEIMYGDYKRIFSDLKMYQQVTPQDIKRVAVLYLQPNHRNTVTVLPEKSKGKT